MPLSWNEIRIFQVVLIFFRSLLTLKDLQSRFRLFNNLRLVARLTICRNSGDLLPQNQRMDVMRAFVGFN